MTKAHDAQVRLKGNLYARPDYFTTDVAKGATRTPTGTRVCTLTNDFLLGFRDALVYECGKSFRAVMKSCGKRWGSSFVARFEKELTGFYQTPIKDLPAGVIHTVLADAFNAHGWGRLTIDLSATDRGYIAVELTDSVMPALIKESDRNVDHMMTGLLAAIFSRFAGSELDCVQTDCPTRGAASSRFILSSPARVAELDKWIDDAPVEAPITHDAVVKRLAVSTPAVAEAVADANGVLEPAVVA